MKNININPMFLLLMSILVLLIALYSKSMANKNILYEKEQFEQYKIMALKYNDLKISWSDINVQKKVIEKLLISSSINNANVNFKNNKVKVIIQSMSTKKLHKFINKLLNKKLNIRKLNFNKNSLEFEVGQ